MSVTPENDAPVSVDDDIDFLTDQVEVLKKLGQKDASDGEVYDFSVRWGTGLAGRLPRLVHYSSLGLLNPDDQQRFNVLCEELRGLCDLAENLGLVRPLLPDELDASAPGHRRLRMRSSFVRRRHRS